MAQRLPTRCNPDDRLNQRVLAGTMIKACGFMIWASRRRRSALTAPRPRPTPRSTSTGCFSSGIVKITGRTCRKSRWICRRSIPWGCPWRWRSSAGTVRMTPC